MSKKWISFLVAAVVGAVILAPSTAFATCQVASIGTLAPVDTINLSNVIPGTYPGTGATPFQITPTPALPGSLSATGLAINQEGQAERAADILIFDDGTGVNPCFSNTQQFTLAYNAPLPANVALSEFATGQFFHFDFMDSAQPNGLRATTSATQVVAGFNTVVTNINITITNAGTAGNLTTTNAGAAIRVKNIRFDATTLSGATISSNVSWNGAGSGAAAGATTVVVATKFATIGTVLSPICTSIPTGDCASGKQSSNGGLTTNVANATFSFKQGFSAAFRLAGTASLPASKVYNDIATNATDVIFNVTNLPTNVTVTFPGTISTSTALGTAAAITMTTANTGAISSSGAVVYTTTKNGGDTSTAMTLAAGTAAATAASGGTFGVAITAPSGYSTTPVQLQACFGPGAAAAFTGDPDVNAAAIPRYATVAARCFIPVKNWFVVTPVRTVLLFPLMQSMTGTGFQFISGLSVANSGQDSVSVSGLDIYGTATTSQTGSVTFYVFGRDTNAGTAVAFSVSTTTAGFTGRGLTSGLLAPGSVLSTSMDAILTAGGQSSLIGHFEGYVIAVTQFDWAHGQGTIFNAVGGATSTYGARVITAATRNGTAPEGLNQ